MLIARLAQPQTVFILMDYRIHSNTPQTLSSKRLRIGFVCALIGVLQACSGSSGSDPDVVVIDPLPAKRGLMPSLEQSNKGFESVHYSGSAVCAACHTDSETQDELRTLFVIDEAGDKRDVSLGTAWETSMMANATRDPYWHAIVAAELYRYGDQHSDEINDVCTRCHAPMANDRARKEGLAMQLFDPGSEQLGTLVKGLYSGDSSDAQFNHAMDGVSCSFCHQIADVGLGGESSFTGGFTVVEFPQANIADRPAYGQYTEDDVGGVPGINVAYMRQQSDFTPVYSAHISTSEACATCHNLNSTSLTTTGEPVAGAGHFIEQAIYTEWLASDYSLGGSREASCQSCHMPRVDQPVLLATTNTSTARENFSEHTLLGPNTVVQSMLRDNRAALGIDPSLNFDESISRNREFLKTAATIELMQASLANGSLSFDVKVINETGHKLPSGYHSRRVYLHVLITDENGQVVYENGRIGADGSIPGVSEDANPATHETHHDVITSATQVQVYQAIMGNSDGNRTHSLLNGLNYLKDNRLTPSGFDKNSANLSDDIGVTGMALDDPDFNNGSDIVTYQVDVNGAQAYTVLVELRYQPLSFGHLQQIFTLSADVDQVDMFRTLYDNAPYYDEVIATTLSVIQ